MIINKFSSITCFCKVNIKEQSLIHANYNKKMNLLYLAGSNKTLNILKLVNKERAMEYLDNENGRLSYI